MCGIAGIWLNTRTTEEMIGKTVEAMNSQILHRGPDGDGTWVEARSSVGFGHRRLAILDLTEAGRQPMTSSSGRYVVTYNGEIYNFRALAAELAALGHTFRGRSDTEILLATIEQWGLEGALKRINGMFAFAVWDRVERELWLARDRLGKKPLYYTIHDRDVVFCSQLRGVLAAGRTRRELDRVGLAQFLRYGFIAAPRTILAGVHKVPPGCVLRITRDGRGQPVTEERRYWRSSAAESTADSALDYPSAKERLRELLSDSVAMRLASDVPLGAFLSGGIDSSLVVALMQRSSASRVRTFTIGFAEGEFNEAHHARAVAEHLGTDHTEALMGPRELLDLVPSIPEIFDEPFADSSQLPTVLLSRLARRDVTVVLSGDGGDELFGGYRRYQRFHQIWRWHRRLPTSARRGLSRAIRIAGRGARRLGVGSLDNLIPRAPGAVGIAQQAEKVARLLDSNDRERLYEQFMSHGEHAASLMRYEATIEPLTDLGHESHALADFEWMMAVDRGWYLPDDILVKVDRATMHASLEARAPLLDYRVAEFADTLPQSFKVGTGFGKRILSDLARDYVPSQILDRPKQGFGVPIAAWLRGPLRDWAESLLAVQPLQRCDVLNVDSIRRLWQRHLSAAEDCSAALWDVLMFQAWHQRYMESPEKLLDERDSSPGRQYAGPSVASS